MASAQSLATSCTTLALAASKATAASHCEACAWRLASTGDGGIGFEWSLLRRLISKGATLLAYPLTASTDPMSGFFCVRKQTLARGDPNPIGFKIALEIMVRCGCSSVVDVPITFRERTAGESKLSPKQNVEYLQQLASLYAFAYRKTLVALAVAGAALVVALHRALFP